MKRTIKNVLMLLALLILIGTSIFTVYHINKNVIATPGMESPKNMEMMQNGMMDKGDIPEKPEGAGGEMEVAPEKPEGASADMQSPTNMEGIQEIQTDAMKGSSQNVVIYYVILVVQCLFIVLIMLYLLMSGFNKKSFKETFVNAKWIIIYILALIIVTSVIFVAEVYGGNKIFGNGRMMEENAMDFGKEKMGNMGMGVDADITYTSEKEITEDTEIDSGDYISTEADENTILVNGEIEVSIENVVITKTGDSDGGDNTSFYGINSAIIAKSGAILNLSNINVETDAVGANGVFSYGGSATTNNTSSDGTIINISDSTITTYEDNSGGIMTTGGGTTNAYNLTINTNGVSSAAVRSDRGGGTINVDGGVYTTTGSGSPAVYSTAEITVNNATLTSKTAEGLVIEGANSLTINNCDVSSNNTVLNGLSTTYKNIFLYQSMSGDADSGNATFTANDSTITTENGDSFYITNTVATINLKNNMIINNDSEGNFLRAQADSWGNSGSNGGDVTLNMTKQEAVGNIVVDTISTLNMSMIEESYFEGIINGDNIAKEIILSLDETSSIKLTGDCYITSLNNAISDNSNIDFNGYTLYVNGEAIN